MEQTTYVAPGLVHKSKSPIAAELEVRFIANWPDESSAKRVFALLLNRYSADGRAYHNLKHLEDCLSWTDAYLGDTATEVRQVVELSVFFHDAVMRLGRTDNEQRSFLLFRKHFSGESRLVEQVQRAIHATRHVAAPMDEVSNLVCDADMAILGAEPPRYAEYSAGVRAEYRVVPEILYRAGRKRFLEQCLRTERLYHLDFFADQLESRARANLASELVEVSRTGGGAPCGV
jgi:predicted metal-dependent HD superfamily phosphohydrolase